MASPREREMAARMAALENLFPDGYDGELKMWMIMYMANKDNLGAQKRAAAKIAEYCLEMGIDLPFKHVGGDLFDPYFKPPPPKNWFKPEEPRDQDVPKFGDPELQPKPDDSDVPKFGDPEDDGDGDGDGMPPAGGSGAPTGVKVTDDNGLTAKYHIRLSCKALLGLRAGGEDISKAAIEGALKAAKVPRAVAAAVAAALAAYLKMSAENYRKWVESLDCAGYAITVEGPSPTLLRAVMREMIRKFTPLWSPGPLAPPWMKELPRTSNKSKNRTEGGGESRSISPHRLLAGDGRVGGAQDERLTVAGIGAVRPVQDDVDPELTVGEVPGPGVDSEAGISGTLDDGLAGLAYATEDLLYRPESTESLNGNPADDGNGSEEEDEEEGDLYIVDTPDVEVAPKGAGGLIPPAEPESDALNSVDAFWGKAAPWM